MGEERRGPRHCESVSGQRRGGLFKSVCIHISTLRSYTPSYRSKHLSPVVLLPVERVLLPSVLPVLILIIVIALRRLLLRILHLVIWVVWLVPLLP